MIRPRSSDDRMLCCAIVAPVAAVIETPTRCDSSSRRFAVTTISPLSPGPDKEPAVSMWLDDNGAATPRLVSGACSVGTGAVVWAFAGCVSVTAGQIARLVRRSVFRIVGCDCFILIPLIAVICIITKPTTLVVLLARLLYRWRQLCQRTSCGCNFNGCYCYSPDRLIITAHRYMNPCVSRVVLLRCYEKPCGAQSGKLSNSYSNRL